MTEIMHKVTQVDTLKCKIITAILEGHFGLINMITGSKSLKSTISYLYLKKLVKSNVIIPLTVNISVYSY